MEPTTVCPDAITAERQRVSEINALTRQYPKQITREHADKFVNEGTPVEAVRKHVLDAQIADAQANEVRNLNIAGLTERDKRKYSLLRAISTAADDGNCFEMEVSKEKGSSASQSSTTQNPRECCCDERLSRYVHLGVGAPTARKARGAQGFKMAQAMREHY